MIAVQIVYTNSNEQRSALFQKVKNIRKYESYKNLIHLKEFFLSKITDKISYWYLALEYGESIKYAINVRLSQNKYYSNKALKNLMLSCLSAAA